MACAARSAQTLDVNQRLARLFVTQRNTVMVLMLRHQLVLSHGRHMRDDALPAIVHIDASMEVPRS
ncbi:MAG: hypothetical protein JWN34_1453 [Bryobacterales bacterium]|nr:hypothetical protein [Bryobacterales bacterium]